MTLTKGAMQSFFNDRSNTDPTAPGLAENNKRSFSLFGRKKSKVDPSPPPTVVKTAPHVEHSPAVLPPVPQVPIEIQKPTTPQSRKSAKPRNHDVDDELREHLRKEGMAFLAYADPAKVAAVIPDTAFKKPVTPVNRKPSNQQDMPGPSISNDAPRVTNAIPTEESKPKVAKNLSTPPTQIPTVASINASSKQNAKSEKKLHTKSLESQSENKSVSLSKINTISSSQSENQANSKPASGIPTIAKSSELQPPPCNSESNQQGKPLQPPPHSAPVPVEIPSGPHSPIERTFSDKSRTDSGKDLGSDTGRKQLGRSSAKDASRSDNSANTETGRKENGGTPLIVTEPPALDESRRLGPNVGRHPPESRPVRRRLRQDGAVDISQGQQFENRNLQVGNWASPESANIPQRRPTTSEDRIRRDKQPSTTASGDEANKSSANTPDERPRAFSLPVPVMLPPSSYSTTPNSIQLSCLTDHRHSVQCTNLHHRIMCMVCHSDSPSERWTCSYCALRFCSKCKAGFLGGKKFDEIVKQSSTEEWQSQSAPTSPTGPISRNIHWELACVLEAGGRLGGPFRGRRSPPQCRRRSPPHHTNGEGQSAMINGRLSTQSVHPDENIPTIHNQLPSPTGSDHCSPSSRTGSLKAEDRRNFGPSRTSSSSLEYAHEDEKESRKSFAEHAPRETRKMPKPSAARCASSTTTLGGTPAEQRRALLGGGF